MNRLTTIAALPSGAGCAASLPAEVHSEPRLLQDETQTYDSKGLSRWFAGRPNARQEARTVAEEIAGSTEGFADMVAAAMSETPTAQPEPADPYAITPERAAAILDGQDAMAPGGEH